MAEALRNDCPDHADWPFECPDMLLHYDGRFDEYGLIVHDGGRSTVGIAHCPFCGSELPASKRDAWFDAMEALGFDDPLGVEPQDVPEHLSRSGWWTMTETARSGPPPREAR